MNLQQIEPLARRSDDQLDVHSVFATIQGEGPFVGTPAVFVRLAGCNLMCPSCDTVYTGDCRKLYTVEHLKEIVEKVSWNTATKLVVITGGEPFRQNFIPFSQKMAYAGWTVQVETNGVLSLPDIISARCLVVCSPKATVIHPDIKRHISALKYVIAADCVSPIDGLPTKVLGYNFAPLRPWPSFAGDVFLQPVDELDETKNIANLKAAVDSCLMYGYRLSVQTHKLCGLP